jgi:CubicO group peptidase (beta-lactamase class C family)
MKLMLKGRRWLAVVIVCFTSSLVIANESKDGFLELAHQKMKPNIYTNIDSMLVYRNKQLISERYYGRFDRKTTHRTHSTFKSINALITLIAIDQGLLKRDEQIVPLLSRFATSKSSDPRRNRITVAHLLNMTSGLACDEAPSSDGPNHELGVDEGATPLQYSFDIAMSSEPGEQWHYCSANSFLLAATVSAALDRANRESIFEFADRYLIKPLGITNYRFTRSADGRFLNGQGNSHFRPSDLAKFGQLLLNKGLWDTELGNTELRDTELGDNKKANKHRIVSEESIQEIFDADNLINWSFTDGLTPPKSNNTRYSQQWYQTTFAVGGQSINVIHSWGNGGQYIFTVPQLDAVIVFTGSNQGNFPKQKQPFDIMQRYVLPELLELQSSTSVNQ